MRKPMANPFGCRKWEELKEKLLRVRTSTAKQMRVSVEGDWSGLRDRKKRSSFRPSVWGMQPQPQHAELTLTTARSLSRAPALTPDCSRPGRGPQPPTRIPACPGPEHKSPNPTPILASFSPQLTACRSPGPAQPYPIQGPSPDNDRKPSLSLSPPTPAPNLTKTFAPNWTLTLNPAPEPQPSPARPDPIQGPRPDHYRKPSLSLGPTHGPRPQPSAPVPAVILNPEPDPSHQPVAAPTLPQFVPDPNPNPRLSQP
eukprot:g20879.t1